MNKTELNDRTLWCDGDSSYKSTDLLRLLQLYVIKYVDDIDDNVKVFNKHVAKEQELKVKTEVRPFSFEWMLPEKYKTLDVIGYIVDKHEQITQNLPKEEVTARDFRLAKELYEYEKRNLFDVLRAIIFVINTLTETNVIWGVGRGSSVSSYVLYIIGVHDVDSFAYDLNVEDFLHD